jgi:hypothetical protein
VNTVAYPHGLGHRVMPEFVKLYSDYGLDIDMEIRSPSMTIQSIEQEYQAYIMGRQSDPSIGILKYWEVCI